MQISDSELFCFFPSIFGRHSNVSMNLEEDVNFKVSLQTRDGKADRESGTKGAKKAAAWGSETPLRKFHLSYPYKDITIICLGNKLLNCSTFLPLYVC